MQSDLSIAQKQETFHVNQQLQMARMRILQVWQSLDSRVHITVFVLLLWLPEEGDKVFQQVKQY